MKHIDVARLRLQDEIRSNRLVVRRVSSEQHMADVGTKALSRAVTLGIHVSSGPWENENA